MAVLHDDALSIPAPLAHGLASQAIIADGRVAIVSQSHDLAFQAAQQTTALSLGDPSIGLDEAELSGALSRQAADSRTKGVVLIVDQHGRLSEALLQQLAATTRHKPVVAFVAGDGSHAAESDAVVCLTSWSRARQARSLEAAGAVVVERAERMGLSLLAAINDFGGRSTSGTWADRWRGDFASTMRLVEQEVYGPC
ncbi:MAG: hypothetical protein AAF495_09365 [Pseudomonadota bacterium]